jgi:hypothetical protein
MVAGGTTQAGGRRLPDGIVLNVREDVKGEAMTTDNVVGTMELELNLDDSDACMQCVNHSLKIGCTYRIAMIEDNLIPDWEDEVVRCGLFVKEDLEETN